MVAAERAPAAEMDWVEAAWAAAETVAVALGAAAKVEVATAWAEKGTVAVARHARSLGVRTQQVSYGGYLYDRVTSSSARPACPPCLSEVTPAYGP